MMETPKGFHFMMAKEIKPTVVPKVNLSNEDCLKPQQN